MQILVCVYLWTSISSGSSKRSCVLYDTHIVRFNGGVVGFFCLLFGRIWCGCKHGCVYTVHYVGNSMKFLVLRTDWWMDYEYGEPNIQFCVLVFFLLFYYITSEFRFTVQFYFVVISLSSFRTTFSFINLGRFCCENGGLVTLADVRTIFVQIFWMECRSFE